MMALTLLSASESFPDSVVKLEVTAAQPNYARPWESRNVVKYGGSGVLIEGNRILTAAHVVSNARFIELQKENDPRRYAATVRFISHQADLALLQVRDEAFFKGMQALPITEQVALRDPVTVLGYPLGGRHLSITTGVLSRIGYGPYSHSYEYLPRMQVDAAVNAGNSGGPALDSRNRIVGIVMASLRNSSNISYLVPGLVIRQFLDDIRDGRVDGLHHDDVALQIIDNDSLRDYYGLKGRTGVLIQRVGLDETLLKPEDILLEIDGFPVADDGSIAGPYGRIDLNFAFHRHQIGETVPLRILRQGRERQLDYPIHRIRPPIYREFEKPPRYYIYGGLVFTPLTLNAAAAAGEKCNLDRLVRRQRRRIPGYTEAVMVLRNGFPTRANHGYTPYLLILDTVNGVPIRSFAHFVTTLEKARGRYVRFRFLDDYRIVLDREEVRKSEETLKRLYRVDRLKELGE
jgi:S1-C subfamily serine protease